MDLIPLFIVILLAGFWFWMCWDMMYNEELTDLERGLWGVGFVFLSLLTAGFYYFTEYRRYRHR